MKQLATKQYRATGAIRLNRVPNRRIVEKKELMKSACGFMAAATDENTGVAICLWKNNNIVMVASNVHGVEPLKPTERRAKSVPMPDCVAKYNEVMLGVDKQKIVFFDFHACFECCSRQCSCYLQPNA